MRDIINISQTAAAVIEELFSFDGQIEELCCLSEQEGEFSLSADQMIAALHDFIKAAKAIS